jgi:hypothetical protein
MRASFADSARAATFASERTSRSGFVVYRDTGDRHSEATALNNLGLALQEVRLSRGQQHSMIDSKGPGYGQWS